MDTQRHDAHPRLPTYVVGHLNPDTDAIASAVGYAWLLAQRDGVNAVPARAGALNPQTAWVLKTLGLEPPQLLSDASPVFESVARRFETVDPARPLSDAWRIAHQNKSVVPVVTADGRPYGLISGLSVFDYLGESIGPHPEREHMHVAEVLAVPSRAAADTTVPRFGASMRIRDALPRILREERDDFWVVDERGHYVGICRQPDLLNPPRMRLVLVDHNEPGQAVGSVEEAVLIEVLDHHRLGNPSTQLPISFHVEPVGSTSTLVSERIDLAGLAPPPELAALLLAGLLSDTLVLTSPTTTERDRHSAKRLGRQAFESGGPLADRWSIESFGQSLLAAGAGMETRDPESIVSADLKIYEAGRHKFGIAQVEVTDFVELDVRLEELKTALNRLRTSRGLNFAMLMVTDIVRGSSRLVLSSPPPELDALPYPPLPNGALRAKGVVSRKKQLLPAVLGLLGG